MLCGGSGFFQSASRTQNNNFYTANLQARRKAGS